MTEQNTKLSVQQITDFSRNGYIILPQLVDSGQLALLQQITQEQLQQRQQPFELEAEVSYPGAPSSINSEGGKTIRRLLQAYKRDKAYQAIAENTLIINAVKQLLKSNEVFITPNHHNCIMTKQPAYSSKTNWHRDTRYWHFNNKYLINAWLALGDETEENGGMLILPGSHRWDVKEDCLDTDQFLIDDFPANQTRLALAEHVDLKAGDCLLFSAHCFHAAGANKTRKNKYSLVFTYHSDITQGLANTRSSEQESIKIT